jgi:hypothetical protein
MYTRLTHCCDSVDIFDSQFLVLVQWIQVLPRKIYRWHFRCNLACICV